MPLVSGRVQILVPVRTMRRVGRDCCPASERPNSSFRVLDAEQLALVKGGSEADPPLGPHLSRPQSVGPPEGRGSTISSIRGVSGGSLGGEHGARGIPNDSGTEGFHPSMAGVGGAAAALSAGSRGQLQMQQPAYLTDRTTRVESWCRNVAVKAYLYAADPKYVQRGAVGVAGP